MDTKKMSFIVSMTVTLVLLSITDIKACTFPSFMQNSTDRDWWSGVRDQFTDFTVQVVVSGNIMHVTSTDTSVQSYTRFCEMRKPGDKYLVAHEEAGQSATRYTCMQFVKRSHNVVQLRVAGISTQMDGHLCDDDNMVLDSWILIDRSHIAEDRQMCPLRGGFSFVMYDKVRSRGICDSYQGHTRLESECVNGEGLLFHFRDVQCVPQHVYMYAEQKTVCLAHWQEGSYTFILIKHDRDNYIWMFRYQTFYGDQQHGDSFVAFLLNDLVAETGNQLTATNNYVRLSCARDQPVLVTSLCVDDYEICSYRRDLEPCPQRDQMALTCPLSCGVCNASRPTICNFPAHLQGEWREMARSGAVSLSVNTSSLTIHGHMDELFHCIQWDPPSVNSDGFTFTEKMLVTDYQNGCKPRYSCARFLQNGPNTLFFGISESKRWPITRSLVEAITCGVGFDYVQDTTRDPNPFRG